MPRLDVTIDGKSLADFGVIPTTYELAKAEPKIVTVDVDGRDGELDLTSAYGFTRFKTRTLSITARDKGPIAGRSARRMKLASAVAGNRLSVGLSTYPGYVLNGRATLESKEDGSVSVYTIDVDCDPYLSKGEAVFYANCAGGVYLVFTSGDKPVHPIFEVPSYTELAFGDVSYALQAGTWTIDDVWFTQGQNVVFIDTYPGHGDTTWDDIADSTWDALDYRWSELYWLTSGPPQTEKTWADIDTWDSVADMTWLELIHSGASTVDIKAYVAYEIGDLA